MTVRCRDQASSTFNGVVAHMQHMIPKLLKESQARGIQSQASSYFTPGEKNKPDSACINPRLVIKDWRARGIIRACMQMDYQWCWDYSRRKCRWFVFLNVKYRYSYDSTPRYATVLVCCFNLVAKWKFVINVVEWVWTINGG